MTTPPPDPLSFRPPGDAVDPLGHAATLAAPVEPAAPHTPCQHVFERFFLDRRLRAIPVVDDGRPVGLVGREAFLEAYRHGPCRDETGLPHRVERHLGEPPRTFDAATTLDDLAELFVADAGQACAAGLIVTRGDRYLGVIAPHALVRAIAERDLGRRADSAFRDEATGLASASLFEDRLVMAVAAADRTRNRVAALVLDLRPGDAGPATLPADAVVKAVADRLEPALRKGDTIARLGHARLGIVLPAIGHVEGARLVGRKLLETLEAPLVFDGDSHVLSPRLGIAVFPDDAVSARRLMQCAASAVDQTAGPAASGAWTTVSDPVCYGTLRSAIERQELTLVYQPQLDLVTGRPCGVEALVRWTQDGGQAVAANRIIELAESSGLMAPLTEWVLGAACAQMRAWHAGRVLVVRLAVNVSGAEARQPSLPALVERVLAETGVPPAALELELTEQALLAQGRTLTPVLARLRAIGVRVAVDDFGSGALPIRQLASLPVDAVKLDAGLTAGIAGDARAESLARSVVAMAHGLGLKVIAEGVESADQAARLREHGCDVLQGFHVSPPLSAGEVPAFFAGSAVSA